MCHHWTSASGSKKAPRIASHEALIVRLHLSSRRRLDLPILGNCAPARDNAFMYQQPLAYADSEFLDSDEARPLRILAEYLEPLRRFKQQNIQDTIVFFGSARIHSRERAEEALERLARRHGERDTDE